MGQKHGVRQSLDKIEWPIYHNPPKQRRTFVGRQCIGVPNEPLPERELVGAEVPRVAARGGVQVVAAALCRRPARCGGVVAMELGVGST